MPPDFVVQTDALERAEVIIEPHSRSAVVHMSCQNRTSRGELLSPSEAHWSTTKSDGMWRFSPLYQAFPCHKSRSIERSHKPATCLMQSRGKCTKKRPDTVGELQSMVFQ